MIRVALKGLAARPVRTALTTLAIVLGVAMVSGSFTLTDTMRGGADSLSTAAYEGTDAIVAGRTAFSIESTDWTAKRPTVDAKLLDRVRSEPAVGVAVGDISDEAKIVARTIFNTLAITVAQRSRELGLLRMVGATRRQVLGSVLLEALAIGLAASAAGIAAGFGIAKGLDAVFTAMDLSLPSAGTVFEARTVVVSMLVGTLVTLVAGLIPAWRATRIAPVAALRDADPGAGRVRLPARGVRLLASVVGRPAQKLGTISQVAFAGAFENNRNVLTLVAGGDGATLGRAVAAFPDAKALTKGAYIDQVTANIDDLLAIFYVLLALAVIVSLFGIVNTLVLSTYERTREIGMLRAVGMTRRQVRRMIRHESIITALIGAGLGIGVGLGLAAIATSLLADRGLTFAIPVASLVVLTVVAGIAGVLAAVVPARRASRLDVLTALAYE